MVLAASEDYRMMQILLRFFTDSKRLAGAKPASKTSVLEFSMHALVLVKAAV